jgi:hypothetical protein
MRHLSRSAMLLGIAALVLTGGGAFALASAVSSNTITVCVNHKTGALYKARRCATHDAKLSWNKQGARGKPGSALAYAHVLYDSGSGTASFDSSQTRGMGGATVTAEGGGGFCFGNLPFTPHNATASIDWPGAEEDTAQIQIVPGGTTLGCEPGESVRVETINIPTDTEEHVAFYITFN